MTGLFLPRSVVAVGGFLLGVASGFSSLLAGDSRACDCSTGSVVGVGGLRSYGAPGCESGTPPKTVVFVGGHRGTYDVCVGVRYTHPGDHPTVTVPPTASGTARVRITHPQLPHQTWHWRGGPRGVVDAAEVFYWCALLLAGDSSLL